MLGRRPPAGERNRWSRSLTLPAHHTGLNTTAVRESTLADSLFKPDSSHYVDPYDNSTVRARRGSRRVGAHRNLP